MTRRRFARPCSFSSRKTARRYGFQGLLNLHSLALRFQGFAAAADAKADDLRRPGHVFPLKARPGGVLERAGHTEVTVDLMRLAGLKPYGVLCELTNPDGSMARLAEIVDFGRCHQMPVLTVADVIAYRLARESPALSLVSERLTVIA